MGEMAKRAEVITEKKLILASQSQRRQDILKELGINFEVIVSQTEELESETDPIYLAKENARIKAESVGKKLEGNYLVLGVDTVVVFRRKIFGKPTDKEEAFYMLSQLRNNVHEVISGVAIYDTSTRKILVDFEVTKVKMWNFDDQFIKRYIETGEPMDKAGAYGIQGIGRLLVEKIDGCYYNVVGLPIYLLQKMLKEYSFYLL